MNQDEAQFSVEAKLENQVYKWANKYKARFLKFRELLTFISIKKGSLEKNAL